MDVFVLNSHNTTQVFSIKTLPEVMSVLEVLELVIEGEGDENLLEYVHSMKDDLTLRQGIGLLVYLVYYHLLAYGTDSLQVGSGVYEVQ